MRHLLLVVLPILAWAEDRAPAAIVSRIDAVTVFLDRALITRVATVAVVAGDQTVVFPDLPAEIDEQSLRVAIAGAARVDGVQGRRVFLDQRREAEVRALEAEVERIEVREREIADRQAALGKAVAYLDAVQDSPFRQPASPRDGQPPVPRPAVEDFRGIIAWVDQQRTAYAAELRSLGAESQAAQPRLAARRQELQQVRGASTLERREVAVALDAATPGQVELRLSYILPGALWVPVYDARVDKARSAVELDYDAQVQQATGEDWNDAQLTLSAARPALQVSPPRPEPWYLAPGQVELQQGYANGSFQAASGSWSPSQSLNAFKGNRASKDLNAAHDNLLFNAAQADLVCRAVERRSTSTVLAVPGRVSVAATGKPHRVGIVRATLPMTAAWHAVPRQSLNTYVTGRMANATELPLLPGAVSVFVAGDLIGAAALDFVAPRETAEFWLGVDEQVKVSRLLDEKRSGKTFFSKRKRIEAAYTIRVRSFRTTPVEVAIYESLPVSQDERIKAAISGLDPKPAALERGMARWDLAIEPGRERSLSFAYAIEFPNEVQMDELQELEQRVQERK
jgi:uncharacterized protein (TIGR02231 family)